MTTQHLEVRVTAGTEDEATKIVNAAVESRTAACAQVSGPIRSTYWWQGAIERSEEFLITLKTTDSKLDELVRVVRAAHSYDVPEIVAVPIRGGLGEYLEWITAETAGSASGE